MPRCASAAALDMWEANGGVRFQVKYSVYIVDRLFDRAQLRVRPKTAVDIRCTRLLARG